MLPLVQQLGGILVLALGDRRYAESLALVDKDRVELALLPGHANDHQLQWLVA